MSTDAPPDPAINYYEEYLAELDEIRRYKWIESQKANEDIGFEKALVEWVGKYRDSWVKARRANLDSTSKPAIEV